MEKEGERRAVNIEHRTKLNGRVQSGGIVSTFFRGPLRSGYSPGSGADGYSNHEAEANIPQCRAEYYAEGKADADARCSALF